MVQMPRLMSTLAEGHRLLLAASGIAPEVARARGYRTVERRAELKRLGFAESQCLAPGLLIPIWNVHGECKTYQLRPDTPRHRDNKPLKYETPAGSLLALDVPPGARPWLADPRRPLFITEGARKADAAVSQGLCCFALLGVWNWRGGNEWGGKTVLPDWDHVALNDGRRVYVVFDSDVMEKAPVALALSRLRKMLVQRGADVRVVYLPAGESGSKVGLDDFLAAGRTVDDLLALATSELRDPPRDRAADAAASPYLATPAGLIWMKPTREGPVPTLLANFTARIAAQVVEDDGAEARRYFDIEAELLGNRRSFAVPAERFMGMGWAAEHLGASAIVYPGFGLKEHARAAIQLLSGPVPERRVYAHTGWRQLGDSWAYLHAGGAIEPEGTVSGIEVRLPDALAGYSLPDPPVGERLKEAVQASLRLLGVAAADVAVPGYGAVWRAPLGLADCGVHLAGPTGAGKTALAALLQQHYGADMDARHLPGSWSSTGNALEGLAHAAKDAVLVVDDFAPSGSATDVQRFNREADRLLRAQGNNAGRLRMRADGSLRPPRPPRGLVLSTGEDVPTGQSLRARLLVLEVGPRDLDFDRLTACQAAAAAGLFAEAMAGYLQWLARRYERVRADLRPELAKLRRLATASAAHRRTPEIVANLALGLYYFLAFAHESGAIGREERDALWSRWWDALGRAAADQAHHQSASEPARRFLELLAAALASGAAHIAGTDGKKPGWVTQDVVGPEAWGWRYVGTKSTGGEDGDDESIYHALGARVGWVDGADLYLEPGAAYAAAQRLGREGADGVSVSLPTLKRRLRERGLLRSIEHRGGRDRLEIRRTLEGRRRDVLHLHADSFITQEVAHVAQGFEESSELRPLVNDGSVAQGTTGPLARDTSEPPLLFVAQANGPNRRSSTMPLNPNGSPGPLGPLREVDRNVGETRTGPEEEWEEVV